MREAGAPNRTDKTDGGTAGGAGGENNRAASRAADECDAAGVGGAVSVSGEREQLPVGCAVVNGHGALGDGAGELRLAAVNERGHLRDERRRRGAADVSDARPLTERQQIIVIALAMGQTVKQVAHLAILQAVRNRGRH